MFEGSRKRVFRKEHAVTAMSGAWKPGVFRCRGLRFYSIISALALATFCHAWLPDTTSKLINDVVQTSSTRFIGNLSYPDHFTILSQDHNSILLGGRNIVYNLSIYDFTEQKQLRIQWPSSEAHSQLCMLKGKTEDDCQNYIRILASIAPGRLLVCGTNSYKPLCRHYTLTNGKYKVEREIEGIGVCPYDPEHNSTALYHNNQLYSATVADFSGGDPLIYREPQRTERSDLKQLNAPNFVSSVPYDNYIFFFYRETAVEFINCGKIIYSRVARVCRDDKGGPHQFGDRWTSFLKARLNCSVPGEYPFYFNEIQSTSDIIEGSYGSYSSEKIIYGTLTTPNNAIGGSAICAYRMADIIKVFEGSFKSQESMNANWLPMPKQKVPEPRPGQCVPDSRILPENAVNFVKTHSLMEDAVPALFGQPILIRVSLQYRFTTITVDPQVQTVNGDKFDVLYVGTDDGKVLKVVNIPNGETAKAVVISDNNVIPNGMPIKQLKVATNGQVIVVVRDEVKLVNLNQCHSAKQCQDCIGLQDPHCAWDINKSACVSVDSSSTRRFLVQDVVRADGKICGSPAYDKKNSIKAFEKASIENEIIADQQEDSSASDPLLKNDVHQPDCEEGVGSNQITGCAVRQRLVIYTAETLHLVVIGASLAGLFVGFIAGYLFSRRFHPQPHYPDMPFIEQHNHLERLSGNPNGFLTPRANKAVNLVVNVVPPSTPPPPKKDNLETSKDLNIASDGTLQKIKKTYI